MFNILSNVTDTVPLVTTNFLSVVIKGVSTPKYLNISQIIKVFLRRAYDITCYHYIK